MFLMTIALKIHEDGKTAKIRCTVQGRVVVVVFYSSLKNASDVI